MNESYRHKQLLALLAEKKVLSTVEIMQTLAISPATARRDINKLSDQGKLRKVRNGAELIDPSQSPARPKVPLKINNAEEKQRIAEVASRMCQEGQSVVLTCGSTMLMLGDALCGKKLQIITNYLPLANRLIEQQHDDIVIMGGQYNKTKKVTLSLATQNETMYSANMMFTSGKGFTEAGLFKTDMIIANSEQRVLSKIGKLVVLLDSTKLGKQVGMLFSELSHIDTLITGREADPALIQRLREKGLNVVLA